MLIPAVQSRRGKDRHNDRSGHDVVRSEVHMANISYKRILVPLDGSAAERIFPHVEELAKQHASKLILLYVIEPSVLVMSPGISMMVAPPPQELESYWKSVQEAEQEGEKYLKRRSAALAKKGFTVEL